MLYGLRCKDKTTLAGSTCNICLLCFLWYIVLGAYDLESIEQYKRELKFMHPKIKFLTPKTFAEYYVMVSSSHMLIRLVLHSTLKSTEKIQIAQNKCIHIWLKLDKRHHISSKELWSINLLAVDERVQLHQYYVI